MGHNRTGRHYMWWPLLLCWVLGHQAPYESEREGEWVPVGEVISSDNAMMNGSVMHVWQPKIITVCPRCGDDLGTPERETF